MFRSSLLHTVLKIFISLVWLINGLFCKVLNLVPRHELIVARILGTDYAPMLTKVIGGLEVTMFIWIITGIKSRWCTIFQIIVILTMNIIELVIAPDLLLFGSFNIIVAILFTGILVVNEFILTDQKK